MMPALRVFLLVVSCAVAVHAQGGGGVRTTTLAQPERVLATDFTQVRGVRELADGRVIISDRLDKGVVGADFATGRVTPIGRTGRGPHEYRLPTALLVMPGDSTLLIDEGNSRVAVIGPDLRIHRSFSLMLPGFGVPMGSRGVDTQGRYYVQIPGWANPNPLPGDSVLVVRFDPRANRVDTVTRVKGYTPRASAQTMGLPYVIFAAQDAWAVGRDGRVGVARAGDYHVDWYEPGGRSVRGAPVAYRSMMVTMADRVEYARRFLENSSTSGRGPDGGLSAIPAAERADTAVRSLAERQPFAPVRPPFTDAAVHVSPSGQLWVERSLPLGEPSSYDVFDTAGSHIERVTLPRGRRLAALGVRFVYLVATDEDGLQKVERYAAR